jgi:hypothetical protein
MKHRSFLSLGFLFLFLLPALACDKVSPVAPEGTTITVSAAPARISTTNGSATITAVVRKANGTPVNPGTEIRFDTNLGVIDSVVTTDSSGVARATLRGDGRVGMATVRASTGSIAPVMVDVPIGTTAGGASLTASPSTVPEGGGTVTLTVLVRDDQGQPLRGATVNFNTPVGSLDNNGGFQTTDQNGRATDRLRLTATDVGTLGTDSFEAGVEVSSGGAMILSDTVTINVLRPPRAAFSFTTAASSLQVAFRDESTPEPTSWRWEFGDGQISTQRNPTHRYSAEGTYQVTLTVRNAVGEDSISDFVVVGDGS